MMDWYYLKIPLFTTPTIFPFSVFPIKGVFLDLDTMSVSSSVHSVVGLKRQRFAAFSVLISGISIPSITLDCYCFANNISKIDFAKIDLEGHELSALKGWETCLKDHIVKAIYIEIMEENQKRYGLKTNEPLVFLESLGYELFLCKEDDFADFGEPPRKYEFESKKLILSKWTLMEQSLGLSKVWKKYF